MFGLGQFTHFLYPWGLILQGLAIVHFIRRRPDTYWLYIILFIGPIGAAIYILAEMLPDLPAMTSGFKVFSLRKRIKQLQLIVKDNPAVGNLEELGDLLFESGDYAQAKEAFDRAIAGRTYSLDPYYKRGQCLLKSGDITGAIADFEKVVAEEPGYDYRRAQGLLAHAYALSGQADRADRLFRQVTTESTLSETYLNYADFLRSQGRNAEAREWAQKVLDKKPTLPGYLKRRERPWFRSAKAILKSTPV